MENEKQPAELLTYLGVSKTSVGRRYILFCFLEISNGCPPGVEVYERVAQRHGRTAAQIVRDSQRALNKAQKKRPREWEEIVPGLDMGRAGLTLFLHHATGWLRRNRIAAFRREHLKYRMPIPKSEGSDD